MRGPCPFTAIRARKNKLKNQNGQRAQGMVQEKSNFPCPFLGKRDFECGYKISKIKINTSKIL